MKHAHFSSAAAALLIVLVPTISRSGEMTEELKIDQKSLQRLHLLCATYGYNPQQSVRKEVDGLRFRLPADDPKVTQSGIYSYFALSGDCEVSFMYELLTLQPPKKGYGSGVGLAFDTGDAGMRGAIQRVCKPSEGNGYVLQCGQTEGGGKMKEEDRFQATTTKKGRLGLRRVQKELIFLTSETPTGELVEIERLPFTDQTIRVVRLFADPGNSPTALDIRVRQLVFKSEQRTGGIPKGYEGAAIWEWLWLVVPVAGAGVLFWFWRTRWRRSDDDENGITLRRRAPLKKA